MALFVAEADCGRGVFSDRALRTGEVIERAPVLAIPQGQIAALNGTVLYDYWFGWGASDQDAGVSGGYGSLYNHSFAANIAYRKDLVAGELQFVARRDIAGGEEFLPEAVPRGGACIASSLNRCPGEAPRGHVGDP